MIVVAALYKFTRLDDYKQLQEPLKTLCVQWGVKGTLLLAQEGINGTVAGSREAIDALSTYLQADSRFTGWEYKESSAHTMPFKKMKVRLKKEIVTLGVPGLDPTQEVGTYVSAQEWNALLQRPDVVLVDTRNDYEVELGTFKGAQNPHTQSFREFVAYTQEHLADKKDKPIAMFCTGGIRCEKSTAYLKSQGFKEVYHLKGGVLRYLEDVSPEQSMWQGECFVFDERIALGHHLEIKPVF